MIRPVQGHAAIKRSEIGRLIMTVSALIANPYRDVNREIVERRHRLMKSPAFRNAVKRGFEDYKASRVTTWGELRQELGL